MARAKKKAAAKSPSADTLPEAISKDAFSIEMVKLRRFEPFRLLMAQWHNIRIDILQKGKEKKDATQWAVLEGFDLAIMEPEKWADYSDRRSASNEGAPTSGLEGGEDD